MPRNPRFWAPGLVQHITSRGNRKSNIFLDKQDYLKYLTILVETKEKLPFQLHSYCLMTNHVHLLIGSADTPTKKIIQRIHSRYAMYFNRKYDLSGHLFQGRYHASPVFAPIYLLEASRYIHLNPIKANLVTYPEDYKWSSYRAFFYNDHKSIIHKDEILKYFRRYQENPEENYKKYIELARQKWLNNKS